MDKQELTRDVKNGLSTYQLAAKYIMGQTTVRYWLKKFKLTTAAKTKTLRPSKYEHINWTSLQSQYDAGTSWRELGESHNALAWGVKNKKFKTRGQGESNRLRHLSGNVDLSPWKSEEFRKKCAKNGGVKPNAGRCKSITYISPIAGEVHLNGTWEYKYAMWLDENKVQWKRNTDWFPYEYQGKMRKYFPDFRLMDDDKYIEVKGYETDKDRAKWTQFPKTLVVLKRKDLVSNPYNFKL